MTGLNKFYRNHHFIKKSICSRLVWIVCFLQVDCFFKALIWLRANKKTTNKITRFVQKKKAHSGYGCSYGELGLQQLISIWTHFPRLTGPHILKLWQHTCWGHVFLLKWEWHFSNHFVLPTKPNVNQHYTFPHAAKIHRQAPSPHWELKPFLFCKAKLELCQPLWEAVLQVVKKNQN